MHGAGDGIRTRDIDLGKVALYQLSYSRLKRNLDSPLAGVEVSNPADKTYVSRPLSTDAKTHAEFCRALYQTTQRSAAGRTIPVPSLQENAL